MADVPCDICGSQDHDYYHCQAGALLESQMPGTSQPGQNDGSRNLSPGPLWLVREERTHIPGVSHKFISQSMKERFPKMKKKRKSKILEYTCRQCGEQHPFNRYCPYTAEPPIVPGECRSCATLTNHHDEECELVAIKDRIGLCAFCGTSATYTWIARIGIQIGGLKEYYPARRSGPCYQSSGRDPQRHHHTMVSAPSLDQPGMDVSFVPS